MQTHTARKPFAALLLALALAWLGGGCTPSGPKALLQGAELIRKGKYEAAITKLKIATDLIRNDARAWNYLGLAYHGAGQFGEAIIAYQRAQQIDQNLAEARYNLGELYLEQGNPVSAADEFSIFTALQPKSVEGWLRLGDAHLQNQRLDRAQTSYYMAINLKRETPEAFNGLGLILLQRKDPRDAYRHFAEAYKYDADFTPAILNMAIVAQEHLNALPTALMKYREYLTKAPDAPNASAVQSAIRQLNEVVNPQPETKETTIEVAEESTGPSKATNASSHVEVRTNTPVPTATNVTAAVATNAPAAAPPRTNAPKEKDEASLGSRDNSRAAESKPATVTNKPPVQTARTEVKPAPVAPGKGVTEKVTEPVKAPEPSPEKSAEKVASKTPEKIAENVQTTSPPKSAEPATKVEEEPPLEEVKVEEAAIQPAEEISAPGDIQPPPTKQTSAPMTSKAPVTAPDQSSLRADRQPQAVEQKRGFFQRINPVNLFRSDKPEASEKQPSEVVTPLPPETSRPSPSVVEEKPEPQPGPKKKLIATTETPDTTPIPATNVLPRYQYGRIKRPVAGDRSAAERLFGRGIGAQSRRDSSGAATFFAAAAQADPTYFAAYYNLGLVAFSEGQLFKALSAFETALVLEPNSADTRYNFALTLQRAGFPVDAAAELEKLLAKSPRDTRSRLLLGNVYSQALNNVPAARHQYQEVLALEPQHPQATAIRYWLAQHP